MAPQTVTYGLEALEAAPASDGLLLALSGPALDETAPRPERISAILGAAYRAPGGGTLAPEALSLVDRQAALLRLATTLGRWPADFVTGCATCGTGNHLRVSPAEFTHRPGSRRLAAGGRLYMAPNGHHEALLVRGKGLTLADLELPAGETTSGEALFPRSADPSSGASVDFSSDAWPAVGPRASDSFSPATADLPPGPVTSQGLPDPLERLEPTPGLTLAELLDRFAAEGPSFEPSLPWSCATCGTSEHFWFDPLAWLTREAGGLLAQIHALAGAYGWTEAEILALPVGRRRAYQAMIGAAP